MSRYPHGEPPTAEDLARATVETVAALEAATIPYLLVGGAGAQAFARPRATDDIDVFVRPDDAAATLSALAEAGFDTEETDPTWLFKATRHGVLVDVIFRSAGNVYLDEEMLAHGRHHDYRGARPKLISPEDLVVIKALSVTEATPHHWFDALAVIARGGLDWGYLLRRASCGPRRVLSLLLFAESVDLAVPAEVIHDLNSLIHAAPGGEP